VAADHAGSKQSHREGQLHSIQLLDHNDLGAGPGGDMRKLGGDILTSAVVVELALRSPNHPRRMFFTNEILLISDNAERF
jgi:hypothetical protein